jgi:WD40-like Beta Propeller Repeat
LRPLGIDPGDRRVIPEIPFHRTHRKHTTRKEGPCHECNIHLTRRGRRTAGRVVASAIALVLIPAGLAIAGPDYSDWAPSTKIDEIPGNDPEVNTSSLDGCPAQSPDGLTLYLASNRTGGKGGLDIWVASRARGGDAWGAPKNLPEPINTASDDFCPTPFEGDGLVFVSRRTIDGVTCGLGDIHVTRYNPARGWRAPERLACAPAGPNSALDEQGPSYVQGQLYFSRSSPVVPGELFVSARSGDGFGPARPIVELIDPAANDIQPNVRKDGCELVFSSNRTARAGGEDIWSARRASVTGPWSAPAGLGPAVNTAVGESRPFLSSDATQSHFG